MVFVPVAWKTYLDVFPIRNNSGWAEQIRLQCTARLHTRSISRYYLNISIIIAFAFIIHLFLDDVPDLNFNKQTDVIFYTVLCVLAFLSGYSQARKRITKWPYFILYYSMSLYVWMYVTHSAMLELYCLFWLIQSIFGTIEAFYMRENGLVNSIFSLDVVMMSRDRKMRKYKTGINPDENSTEY